jgi:DNA-binding CsgD family transcriptional regulator
MERLTKKELRALLESIKERYPNSDLKTFSQRVVSRLSKIVPTEIISHNGIHPRRRRNAHATHPHHAHYSSKRIFRQRAPLSSLDSSAKDAGRYTRPIPREVLSPPRRNLACSSTAQRQVALNRGNKDFADRDRLLLSLLSPHVIHAYRHPKTVKDIQQKFTLVDDALNTLHLGLILLTPTGKVRLATACALQQVREYLGHRSLIGERLPESLRMWVKQQGAMRKKDDSPLSPSRLMLEREGKRLVIRLVSKSDPILFLREERPTKVKPQSPALCSLSSREAQVLHWVSQGKTNREIALILQLSARTVQKHLEHIYRKMGVENRTGAAAKAYEIASMVNKQTSMFFFVVISSLIT